MLQQLPLRHLWPVLISGPPMAHVLLLKAPNGAIRFTLRETDLCVVLEAMSYLRNRRAVLRLPREDPEPMY